MSERARLNSVADRLECTELVYRVARAVDRCDMALLLEQFHPDATDDHGAFDGNIGDFVVWVEPILRSMHRTHHMIAQVVVDVIGDHAASESYFKAYHELAGEDGDRSLVVSGRYLDRFEKRNGIWKISHRLAVFDWKDSAPLTDTYDHENPGPMTFGTRGSDDKSYEHFAQPALLAKQ